MSRFRYFTQAVWLLTLAAAIAAVFVAGGKPAAQALLSGSIGGWYSLTSATLVRATPLMLAGCAVAVAFRSGVFNIGVEGQLLLGATAAAAVALILPDGGIVTILLALAGGALAGALWAGVAAVLRERFGVLEVISSIMLNFVALYGVSYLVRGPLQEPTHAFPQSASIGDAVHLARIPGAGRLHIGFVIALVVLVVAGWIFRHTAVGFRLLAIGENPAAARSAGLIDVRAVTRNAFMASGALAGLAGAVEVLGVTYALYENISPGYGFTAIAVALLARLDPWYVIASAFLFGALEAGAGAMQRDAGVPASVVSVVEAVLILVVIASQTYQWRKRSTQVAV